LHIAVQPLSSLQTQQERAKMRFGLFGSAQARRPTPGSELTDSSQGFREWIENNVEAEALGFHSTFVVEHHFTGFGQVSASLNLLTWLGARTSTLRLGTAVLVLPWHNPVLLAEQAATLDLLSGGRLDFGIGKGYRYNEFAGFATPMEEADSRFDEAMEVITKAFTSDTPWSHNGRHWQYDNIVVEPPSAQRPHPPFWLGAGSERSVRQVAERGYNMLLGQHDLAADVLRWVEQFKADVTARGRHFDPMQVGVARAVHFADTPEELAAAQVRRFQGHLRINKLAERPGDERERFARHDEAEIRHLCDETAIFGTADQIAQKLEALRAGGVEYVIVNFGGSRDNIRRFAREVMPAFAGEPRLADAAK
jgi:alkanesulfonate monooxygenase SsuD/methylene tetrahydromethanopterin reductase-like flavin-dependent oxidoreductase (luciferase family)